MLVSPFPILLKPNPQCDGIRRWGLWEVIRSRGGSLYKQDDWPYKSDSRKPCEVTVKSQPFATETRPFIGIPPGRHPDLGRPASRSTRNSLLLSVSHPVCGILFQQPKQTKTSTHNKNYIFPNAETLRAFPVRSQTSQGSPFLPPF